LAAAGGDDPSKRMSRYPVAALNLNNSEERNRESLLFEKKPSVSDDKIQAPKVTSTISSLLLSQFFPMIQTVILRQID
jgi:hypothetical protein